MRRLPIGWIVWVTVLAALTSGGCLLQIEIEHPGNGPGSRLVSGQWPAGLAPFQTEMPGASFWTCEPDPELHDAGTFKLLLTVSNTGYKWHLPVDMPEFPGDIVLIPEDVAIWHTMRLPAASRDTLAWLPLPRTPLDSPFYYDLLDLVQHLMPVGYAGTVRHWPAFPVPLTTMNAVSGAVDLQATLIEARDILNDMYGETLFCPPDETGNGIRMVHLAGRNLRPACYMTFVRRDSTGAPLRMQLVIGDTYDDPWDRPYALRAMLHELLHGLLLWEHSLDRQHLLWRNGTIAKLPSADELSALRLWRALPAGLDLRRYGRRGELDP